MKCLYLVLFILMSIGILTSCSHAPEAKPTGTRVRLETTMGIIDLECLDAQAPKTVDNFLAYVDAGFYDGTLFHRVIPGFVVQGGGMVSGMKEKQTQAPIQNEADNGVANARGTVAMARTAELHSATSQFYINLKDNTPLNHVPGNPQRFGYCVFARVTEGMDVVDRIAGVATHSVGQHQDVPRQEVRVVRAFRLDS